MHPLWSVNTGVGGVGSHSFSNWINLAAIGALESTFASAAFGAFTSTFASGIYVLTPCSFVFSAPSLFTFFGHSGSYSNSNPPRTPIEW